MWVDSKNHRSQIVMIDGFFTGVIRNESDYWCGSYVDLNTKNIICAITKMGGGTWTNTKTGKTITIQYYLKAKQLAYNNSRKGGD